MPHTEGPNEVNPESFHDRQLADIRRIYGPEKGAVWYWMATLPLAVRPGLPGTDRPPPPAARRAQCQQSTTC